jgi:hypothetical protein
VTPSNQSLQPTACPLARIADSNSRNAVSFSSARTTKRFPSPRCASAIQIVRPLRSTAETQPQLQPALLRLSAMISQCPSKRFVILILTSWRVFSQNHAKQDLDPGRAQFALRHVLRLLLAAVHRAVCAQYIDSDSYVDALIESDVACRGGVTPPVWTTVVKKQAQSC